MNKYLSFSFIVMLAITALLARSLFASDLSSAHFIIRDPVIGTGGGYQASGSFQLNSEGDKLLTGTGSSASYVGKYGFLAYLPPIIPQTQVTPAVSSPTVNYVTTGVDFSGVAYPGSKVYLLKDGQLAASTVAGGDAKFTINLNGLSSGSFVFLIYAEDEVGRKSTLFTFPVTVTSGTTPLIGGVYIAPTIAIDKQVVKKGDTLTIIGQSAPYGNISISVHSSPEIFVHTTSDKYGGYVYNLDTSVLEMGDHLTKSKSVLSDNIVTGYGKTLGFTVGTQNVYADDTVSELTPNVPTDNTDTSCKTKIIGDLNNDCRVNLFDYSILAYWYKKSHVPAAVDLNHDGKVDIIDFSIMAHYWTI